MTQAFGVNDHDEVVGAYTVGTGSSAQTDGFTWRPATASPPSMTRTARRHHHHGVNNPGDLVGFYTDSPGNTDGMLAQP